MSAAGRGGREGDSLRKVDCMTRNAFRRGVVAFLLAGTLSVPGIAAAEDSNPVLTVTGLGAALWDFLTGDLLEDETAPPPSDGSGTGGDVNNGGGAMDPNGGPKP